MLYNVHVSTLRAPLTLHHPSLFEKVRHVLRCVNGRQVLLEKITTIRVRPVQHVGDHLLLEQSAIRSTGEPPTNSHQWA